MNILLPRYIDDINKLRKYTPDSTCDKLVLWYELSSNNNYPYLAGALNGNKLGEAISCIIHSDDIKSLPFELENDNDKPIDTTKKVYFTISKRFTLQSGFYELYANGVYTFYKTFTELLDTLNEMPIIERAYYNHHYFKNSSSLVAEKEYYQL